MGRGEAAIPQRGEGRHRKYRRSARVVASRAAAAVSLVRSWLNSWADVAGMLLLWLASFIMFILFLGYSWKRPPIEVTPFDGPDPTFKQGAGSAMAAIAASQLQQVGFSLDRGAVGEPLAQLSAKLTDTQSKMLVDVLSWFFPPRGFRVEALVHALLRKQSVLPRSSRGSGSYPRENVCSRLTRSHSRRT